MYQEYRCGAGLGRLLQHGVAELHNVRAALAWAVEHDPETALRLGWAFSMYWMDCGPQHEGQRWLERALAADQAIAHAPRATALFCAGFFAMTLGDHAAGRRLTEAGLALFREVGDHCGVAACVYGLARSALFSADFARAQRLFEESLILFRDCEVFWHLSALGNLGFTLIARRDYARAGTVLDEGLALARQLVVAPDHVVHYYYLRALVALKTGDLTGAREMLAESLGIARELQDRRHGAHGLETSAWLATVHRQPERAARLLGAASTLRDDLGLPIPATFQLEFDEYVPMAKAQLEAARWDRAWAAGRAMELDEAIAYALETEPASNASGRVVPAALTPRELEVLRLLATGQSNRMIAAALFLSERTVERHIENLYRKLEVHNRAEATTVALRHQLS
jgi:non-specific serine/threonine protein kinase